MNVLLVDDEKYVIDSIRKAVDWDRAGVEKVYTAFSMGQALELLEFVPVDIIISDIVMPCGNGSEFISAVRERRYEVQVIFLTSYAEFDYARHAIALDSVDYLLKPIDGEKLQDAIERAGKKAADARMYQDYQKIKRNWNQNCSVLKKDIWERFLTGELSTEQFLLDAQKRNLGYQKEQRFFLLCLVFSQREQCQKLWEPKTLQFIIDNVLTEMLEKSKIRLETVLVFQKNFYVAVCTGPEEEELEREVAGEFVLWLGEKLHAGLWCGVGNRERLDGLKESMGALIKMRDNSLSVRNRVLYLADYEYMDRTYQNTELNIWKALLEQEQQDKLLESIGSFLEELEQKEMVTRYILKSFRADITQMVYTWLAGKEIQAHLLFSSQEDEAGYHNALRDIQGAQEYARSMISRAIAYNHYINETESVVERIVRYLNDHYREEIRREDLSNMVYLNPDYISRIFKKEKGVSISSYLLARRVEEAKKLLVQSDLPINAVSISVGYSNFSYFTKMFKENTGYSPLEYRRMATIHPAE